MNPNQNPYSQDSVFKTTDDNYNAMMFDPGNNDDDEVSYDSIDDPAIAARELGLY